jgi:hypothetical protein
MNYYYYIESYYNSNGHRVYTRHCRAGGKLPKEQPEKNTRGELTGGIFKYTQIDYSEYNPEYFIK